MRNQKILIVDDSRVVVNSLQEIIKKNFQLETKIVTSGSDALIILKSFEADLIIMDINLHEKKDGIDYMMEIRKSFDIPVLYLTVMSSPAILEKAKKTDPIGYLLKPFLELQFITMLQMALHKIEIDKKLKESEDKFHLLTENSHDIVLILNTKGKIIFGSLGLKTILGFDTEEFLGKFLIDVVHEDDIEDISLTFEKILEKPDKKTKSEIRMRDRNNSWHTLDCTLINLLDKPSIKGIILNAYDITERRNSDDQLKVLIDKMEWANFELNTSNEELSKANVTKDKFFTIIAHDLKNPFNSILGFANLLYDDYDGYDDNEKRDLIKSLKNSAESAYKLLENLLEWSRLQRGKLPYSPEKANISQIVNYTIDSVNSSAKQKSITISSHIPEKYFANVDNYMVTAVFRNLLSNAIKFTPRNGSINFLLNRDDNFYEIIIEDTGIGISNKVISKIFELESNYTTKGTEGEKGTGLGLILCREFVEKNGGKIWVESEQGKGSRFYFTLPVWLEKKQK